VATVRASGEFDRARLHRCGAAAHVGVALTGNARENCNRRRRRGITAGINRGLGVSFVSSCGTVRLAEHWISTVYLYGIIWAVGCV
jgi:hypothetical protein